MEYIKQKTRTSFRQKEANDFAYFKEQADKLDMYHYGGSNKRVDELKRMKVNYDLYNNILDLKDFEYVCNPYGNEIGPLPATMTNRDIVSGKIKAMQGMERKRDFTWSAIAVNPEATSRREQAEFGMIKDYVIQQIMTPLREQIEMETLQEQEGRDLRPEEQEEIQQRIAQELEARTPQETKKYMAREHQDPAELMATHLLEYLKRSLDLERKFNQALKHGLLSAVQCSYIGILNKQPVLFNVNSMNFNCDRGGDSLFIEDKDWATCEYKMSPTDIMKHFGDTLTDKEIDKIYEGWQGGKFFGYGEEDLFRMAENNQEENNYISVVHCVWKDLRKIGFLTYMDENGEEQQRLVDETYEVNLDFGDVRVEWEWVPEVYETWKIKIGDPIYKNMRPVPGQIKDIDDIYKCKLPYYGVIYDSMNSEPTAMMDRLKMYQYYYNIVMYRLELLIASDKGKKVLMNIGSIPSSSGINLEQWQYFFEATNFMYFDPDEEGSGYQDANTVAKVIDLSMVSDIQKYMEIAEYLRTQAGRSVGITDQVEGAIDHREAVTNTQQGLVQASNILEMYFEMHDYYKRNAMQALLDVAKIAYAETKPRKLSYVLDDMSIQMFDFDVGLLDNSTIGIFVTNTVKAEEAKETIKQLTHAALQNQKVELSDVISVIRQDNIIEAEETLKVAEATRQEREDAQQQQQMEAMQEESERVREFEREKHEMEKEIVVLKEEERRKTVIAQAALTGLSFNPELDQDGDGEPDFLEIAKHGLEADIQRSKAQLEREKFEHQKDIDNKRVENESKKLAIDQAKNQQRSVKP